MTSLSETRATDRAAADEVFESRVHLDVPADVAYAWHCQPGALRRLIPPWDGTRVLDAPGEPRLGMRTILSVPIGPLRCSWVAEHVEVVPGRRFRDVQVRGPFARWDHTHEFLPDGPDACVLIDRIRYVLPLGRLGAWLGRGLVRRRLARIFAYRRDVLERELGG